MLHCDEFGPRRFTLPEVALAQAQAAEKTGKLIDLPYGAQFRFSTCLLSHYHIWNL